MAQQILNDTGGHLTPPQCAPQVPEPVSRQPPPHHPPGLHTLDAALNLTQQLDNVTLRLLPAQVTVYSVDSARHPGDKAACAVVPSHRNEVAFGLAESRVPSVQGGSAVVVVLPIETGVVGENGVGENTVKTPALGMELLSTRERGWAGGDWAEEADSDG